MTRADHRHDAPGLMELFGQMRHHFASVAAELDLTPPQMGVLKSLDDSMPMSHLAHDMGCDASNITWMTDRLEQRGLVERRADPRDRRVKLLVLTDAGRKLREHIQQRLTELPGLHRLTDAERATLARLLQKMRGVPAEAASA